MDSPKSKKGIRITSKITRDNNAHFNLLCIIILLLKSDFIISLFIEYHNLNNFSNKKKNSVPKKTKKSFMRRKKKG